MISILTKKNIDKYQRMFAVFLVIFGLLFSVTTRQVRADIIGPLTAGTSSGTNWTTPGNTAASDDAYAIYNSTTQDDLILTNFGFSIPAGSTINGISVEREGNGSANPPAGRRYRMGLTKDATNLAGVRKADLNLPKNTDDTVTIGGASDLWGSSWSAEDINSSNFGVLISDNNTSADTLNFDLIRVTVDYTVSPEFEQSSYRWFENSDSTDVGSALSSQDTSATAPDQGTPFRLRQLIHVSTSTLALPSWSTSTIDIAGTTGQYTSIDAVDANTIFISYYDATNNDLKFATSTDGGSIWATSAIDTTGTVGQYTSLSAVDANTIYISYYDATNGDLKFATSTDGGSTWATSAIDTTGTGGQYTSLSAVDANTIYISYYDATNGDLKFATSTDGGSTWSTSAIDTTGTVGQYTSLSAVDANTIYISYYDATNGDLKFTASTDGGSTWTTSAIDTAGTVGQYTSIDAVDSNTIYISYYDTSAGNLDLKFAESTDGGNNWSLSVVDSTDNVGQYTSLDAVDANTIFISYYDLTVANQDLKFATSTDGGSTWTTSTIDTTDNVGQYSSIHALDANTLFISYYDVTNNDLKFARSNNGGNTWSISTLDNEGTIGQYTSLDALDTNSAFISYQDTTNGDLKLAELMATEFKLQFAERSGTCDTGFVGETYSDILASSGAIRFYDNTIPLDEDALTATSTDPTHGADTIVNQTYEEANTFTNSEATIPAGQDGKWDFALVDNSAPGSVTYCFRVVESDGALLDTYTVIPEIITQVRPTISSAANQVFEVGAAASTISQITVTDDASSATITATNDLRIAIATSTIDMAWDTSDTTASFGGTASSKVSNPVSYEGGGSVLVISVDTDFSAGDILTISDLAFTNFNTATSAGSVLNIFKDGPGDQTIDDTDDKTIALKGTLTLANHDAGQESNKFNISPSQISEAELFSFKLAPAEENMSISNLVISLSEVIGFNSSHITNATLVVDYDANGDVDAGEDTVGGTGSPSISGGAGTIIFSTSFTATTTRNYILRADVSSIHHNDEMTFDIDPTDLTASGITSLETIVPTGFVLHVRHLKPSGGGGGSVGGAPPAGAGTQTGGGGGGGVTIGSESGFNAPSTLGATFNQWTNPTDAYISDNVRSFETTTWDRQDYGTFGFSIPSGNSIDGISVKLDAQGSTAAGSIGIELSWNGGTGTTTSSKTTGTLTTQDVIYTLGGSTDAWGRTWSPSEFNDGNFELRVLALPSGNTIRLDAIQVKVHHTASGGGGGGGGGDVRLPQKRVLASIFEALQKVSEWLLLSSAE